MLKYNDRAFKRNRKRNHVFLLVAAEIPDTTTGTGYLFDAIWTDYDVFNHYLKLLFLATKKGRKKFKLKQIQVYQLRHKVGS